MTMRNPFKPTAGAMPPLLVGRSEALDSFEEGIDDGPGSPGLLTIFTGARGVGKTVMLSAAEDLARERGWVTISDTATPGLMARLGTSMKQHLEELGDGPTRSRLTAISVAGWGVTRQLPPEKQVEWRQIATGLLDILTEHETGLLITVDEIHAVDRDELTQLAAAIQHLIRDEQPIALLMAGIPKAVSDLLNEDVSTFLRRAERVDLRDVPVADVRDALDKTFTASGVSINHEQLTRAAEATGGYPFLIQLVGYQVWRLANRRTDRTVTDELLTEALDAAQRRLGSTVIAAAVNGLSDVDKTFLVMMADDDGPSRMSEIAARLDQSLQYAGVYRKRLIDAAMIQSAGTGLVDFTVPFMREWLREHAASAHRPDRPADRS
jgi:hypothetical protein